MKNRTVRGVTISYDELENIDTVVKKNMPKDLAVEYKVVSSKEKAVLRKATPVFSGVLNYFPDAIKYVSKASYVGQQQHNPDKPLAWDRSKSGDELDALTRHLIDHSIDPMDDDGVLHLGNCLLYTSPSPRDRQKSRMPSSA